MLSIIIGDNSIGKSLLLKRIKEIVLNPKYLINHFPRKPLEQVNNERNVYSELFLHEENIARYKDSLGSNETTQNNIDSIINCDTENGEAKTGFTSELTSSDYKNKQESLKDFVNINLESLRRSQVNKKELQMLSEKYKRILTHKKVNELNAEELSGFIRRQLIKKLVFTDLFELLKQDCFYESEIHLINEWLSQRRFPYKIQLRNNNFTDFNMNETDINLIHSQTKFKQTLNKITANERLVLHLYLIERDLDLIKIHENLDLNQILLFDEIDNNLDMTHSAVLINFIRYNFIKKMNIQCVFTTNNALTISQCHNQCLLQMSCDTKYSKE
jgi:hypothetical protein